MDLIKKIWVYKYNDNFPIKGYQAKTVCEDYTPIFGYGESQEEAITDLADKVRAYHNASKIVGRYAINVNDTDWNYKESM